MTKRSVFTVFSTSSLWIQRSVTNWSVLTVFSTSSLSILRSMKNRSVLLFFPLHLYRFYVQWRIDLFDCFFNFGFSINCRKEDEGSWRSRSVCALGLASLIFAIELGDVFVASESLALESPPQLVDYSRRRVKISRWSDTRKCAPWRANSFEIIVPENLPRPSHRRNWEAVAFTFMDVKNAPGIQVTSSKTSSHYCFSL